MDEASVALLQMLLPQVCTALSTHSRLREEEIHHRLAEPALDAMTTAAFLVSASGHVEHMNELAAAFVYKRMACGLTVRCSLPFDSGIAVAALLFFGLLPRRRRWYGGGLLAILCLVACGGLFGCDGSNSGSGTSKNPGTTTGSYQVTVTASSGVTTTSVVIPLSVQ